MPSLLAALPVDLFIAFAVFCRVGAFFMTAPAFADMTLNARFRLAGALVVTMAIAPVAAGSYPAWTDDGIAAMTGLIIGELVAGGFLGLAARALMSALNVAGQVIALQMGLSLAQIFDPTQEIQGAIVGGFLAILGTTMIFATDLHHLMLAALVDSYTLMAPASALPMGDLAEVFINTAASAFSLGVRLAAPFILFGLVFYVGAGILSRLMPQAQVFFLLAPANLIFGLILLMLTSGMIMTVFLGRYEAFLAAFLR